MYSDTDAIDQSERIPCLAAGMDPRSLPHSPLESYLLSRIDGCTPWSTLCEIGGMSPELVDELLERWLSGGFLTVEAKRDNTGRLGGAGARETAIDPTLDISEELQQRILNLEAVLEDLNYFEVLGVERSVDARGIKRAYFKLSREFHPDRYFRRSLGSFGPRLERIFKKIVEAYELLHDPATRAEVERSLSSERSRAPEDRQERVVPDSRMASSVLRSSGTRFQHLSRLRESFRSSPGSSVESRGKARRFYDAAQLALGVENFPEAAANVRLAIAFDPTEESYRLGFAEIQAEVHRLRATTLLEQARSVGAQTEALELLEEAIHYRPSDVELSVRSAHLAMELGDLPRALAHAQNAAEIEPEDASHHLFRCRVLRRLGDFGSAGIALQRAEELEGEMPELASEREQVARRARG